MAGQTHSVTRAVHDDVLDDPKGLGVFVRKQVLWIGQTGNVTQPANARNRSCSVCFSKKKSNEKLKINLAEGGLLLMQDTLVATWVSRRLPGEIRVGQVSVGADDAVSDELLLECAQGVPFQQIQSIQQLGTHMMERRGKKLSVRTLTLITHCSHRINGSASTSRM